MTGEDIQELDNAGFYTEGPTISVGTLFNETRIVQVYAHGISLLNAGDYLISLPTDFGYYFIITNIFCFYRWYYNSINTIQY